MISILTNMVRPHDVDTSQTADVASVVKSAFSDMGAECSFPLIDRLFDDVSGIFEGKRPGYQAIDMSYHDFEHTLQATVCLVRLLQGRNKTEDSPFLDSRDWELSLMAVLLHDTGLIKKTGDNTGTGAKYTFIHERRSCDFAREYLAGLGLTAAEIDDVCSAIMCTGPRADIDDAKFRRDEARQIAYLLVTADYLAQMSADDYLEKLPRLYEEFQEAFEANAIPMEDRPYSSLRELLENTPGFWHGYVRPLLDGKMGGAYNYLSPPGAPNPYIDAVEANLEELERRLASGTL